MEINNGGKKIEVKIDIEKMTGSDQRKFLEIYAEITEDPTKVVKLYDSISECIKKFTDIKDPDTMLVQERNKVFRELMNPLMEIIGSKGFTKVSQNLPQESQDTSKSQ